MTAFCLRARRPKPRWLGSSRPPFSPPRRAALADEPITVHLDQAKILKLPDRAATVVIGDPLIADHSIQPGGLAVITGKGYGETNVVVLDKSSAVLMEKIIEVKGPDGAPCRGLSRPDAANL